jgi:diacylglycerol kinase (ATP)
MTGLASKALIVSPNAGSMTPAVQDRLRREFSDYRIIEFDASEDFRPRIEEDAVVVVAGGDGTLGFVARALVGTQHPLAVLGLGTFNNFARALGIPEDIDAAIEVAKTCKPRPVTIGRVNGRPFLEAAAIGIFGEAIELGQSVKDLRFGELGEHLLRLVSARPFRFRLSGDLAREGTALSLVFANTPSTGAHIAIGAGPLTDPFLELSVRVGESRRDLVTRLAASAVLHRHQEQGTTQRFRHIRVETAPAEPVLTTEHRVTIYGDDSELGETPATIEADLGGLSVIMP